MAFFFCRLHAPRASFPHDASERERSLMGEHAAYLRRRLAEGRLVVFGPVADPDGYWGLAVAEADEEAEVRRMTDADPVVRSGLGFRYTIIPMPSAVVRGPVAP